LNPTETYKTLSTTLSGVAVQLHPLKAMYLQERGILLIADTHLGKATHFSRSGLRIPKRVEQNNLDRLFLLLKEYQPAECIILGDLFHSIENEICDQFARFTAAYPKTKWTLVLGNHDILDIPLYESMHLTVVDHLILEPFILTHHPLDDIPEGYYNLCGHIHPGVKVSAKNMASIRVPCFHFTDSQGVLPAFGAFTGLARQKITRQDRVYGVVDDEVVAL